MGLFPGRFFFFFCSFSICLASREATQSTWHQRFGVHLSPSQRDRWMHSDRSQCLCTTPGILLLSIQKPRMISNTWRNLRNVTILLDIPSKCWILRSSLRRMLNFFSLLIRGRNNFSHWVWWAPCEETVLKFLLLPTTSLKYKYFCRGAATSSLGRETCLSLRHVTQKIHKKSWDRFPSLSAHSL